MAAGTQGLHESAADLVLQESCGDSHLQAGYLLYWILALSVIDLIILGALFLLGCFLWLLFWETG